MKSILHFESNFKSMQRKLQVIICISTQFVFWILRFHDVICNM